MRVRHAWAGWERTYCRSRTVSARGALLEASRVAAPVRAIAARASSWIADSPAMWPLSAAALPPDMDAGIGGSRTTPPRLLRVGPAMPHAAAALTALPRPAPTAAATAPLACPEPTAATLGGESAGGEGVQSPTVYGRRSGSAFAGGRGVDSADVARPAEETLGADNAG